MKAMGIDFGLRRIGISLSDETKFLASPYLVYTRKSDTDDLNYLISVIVSNKVDEIVCGLPLNMAGEEETIASETRKFMIELQAKADVKITYVDERLSSVMAEDMLKIKEKDWRKRKQKLDAVAAAIILQDYLDRR